MKKHIGTKRKIPKKKKLSHYKKKAWDIFSKFIRLRDSRNGYVLCCTCPVLIPWKKAQASHFIDGRMNSILFDERGVNSSCYSCNVCKHGNKVEYFRFMQEKHGDKVIDDLRLKSKQLIIYKQADYEGIYERYKGKVEELKKLSSDGIV